MSRFVITFVVALLVLFTLELLQPVQALLIQPFTQGLATLSAALIMPFDDQVIAYGRVLSDSASGFAVSIESGCNGVEAAIVLIAAVVAFPAPAKYKLITIVGGFLAIQVMNLGRIISLFYLGQWNMEVFSFTHLYLWPVLIMLDVLVVFLLHLHFVARSNVSPV